LKIAAFKAKKCESPQLVLIILHFVLKIINKDKYICDKGQEMNKIPPRYSAGSFSCKSAKNRVIAGLRLYFRVS